MAINQPYQTYKQNAVNTSSPGDLTLMLYNGCLKFITLAKRAIEDKNIEKRNENLGKAQNIINELMITLNLEIDISKNMLQMYDYIYRRLVEANTKNDINILNEVEGYVIEFRDTWKEVIKIAKKDIGPSNGLA
ncbi:flagellar protein FliS [Niallia circulans]|jgi:flagellar secretion chaperone FliS|uniref:Flagellar secretion chaperone FliS n=2 Tax=Niallia circulans TaxID=1397 RepID=A0A0J1IBW0_NIACI|nr:flagellar export chaperone FliS [Niallia circulans]KLV23449.1 flagellar biosynthesis protein FliS [Niallia circulans]MCM2981973.1 flagellar export chaperone FliS [Niallia circulans]MDR4316296.1 flagellar export chaperone FliS [Niallia circulans]MED3838533.1 flagellar export chaperone FliS [Niallia circulans]MED4244007.1 flagellar export chaperone FliS [Niallia circulans]